MDNSVLESHLKAVLEHLDHILEQRPDREPLDQTDSPSFEDRDRREKLRQILDRAFLAAADDDAVKATKLRREVLNRLARHWLYQPQEALKTIWQRAKSKLPALLFGLREFLAEHLAVKLPPAVGTASTAAAAHGATVGTLTVVALAKWAAAIVAIVLVFRAAQQPSSQSTPTQISMSVISTESLPPAPDVKHNQAAPQAAVEHPRPEDRPNLQDSNPVATPTPQPNPATHEMTAVPTKEPTSGATEEPSNSPTTPPTLPPTVETPVPQPTDASTPDLDGTNPSKPDETPEPHPAEPDPTGTATPVPTAILPPGETPAPVPTETPAPNPTETEQPPVSPTPTPVTPVPSEPAETPEPYPADPAETETPTPVPTQDNVPAPTVTPTPTPTPTPTDPPSPEQCRPHASRLISAVGVRAAEEALRGPDHRRARVGTAPDSELVVGFDCDLRLTEATALVVYEHQIGHGILLDQQIISIGTDEDQDGQIEWAVVFVFGDDPWERPNTRIPSEELHDAHAFLVDLSSYQGLTIRAIRFQSFPVGQPRPGSEQVEIDFVQLLNVDAS